jgi:hypothetical protein
MDRDQWSVVLAAVKRATRRTPKGKRLRFPDWLIVAMYLWAVAHDRCQSWACDRSHYGAIFRPRKLPSVSQFNRRVAMDRTCQILQLVHQDLGGPLLATALSYLDGKPLVVGVASKDPDAARGHVMGGFAKGYKLHAWMSEDRRIPVFSVAPLNVDERPMAMELMQHVPTFSDRSLILADSNYDTHDLHKAAHRLGARLLCEPRGKARHPVTLRQMGPARREMLQVLEHRPGLFRMVYRQRVNAEGILSNLCSYSGGLAPLPAWVRRLPRVRRWVGAKIILYHARLRVRSTRGSMA